MSIQPDLLSCPFCGSQPMILGMDRAQHPVAGCILSGRTIAAREFREWNKRTQLPDAGQLCNSTVEMDELRAEVIRLRKLQGMTVVDALKLTRGVESENEQMRAAMSQIEAGLDFIAADDTSEDAQMAARLLPIARAALAKGGAQTERVVEEMTGTISTVRHPVVRYRLGFDCGDTFGSGGDYDGPALTVEIADMDDGLAMLRAIAKGGA